MGPRRLKNFFFLKIYSRISLGEPPLCCTLEYQSITATLPLHTPSKSPCPQILYSTDRGNFYRHDCPSSLLLEFLSPYHVCESVRGAPLRQKRIRRTLPGQYSRPADWSSHPQTLHFSTVPHNQSMTVDL
jgi:hypothetical protein